MNPGVREQWVGSSLLLRPSWVERPEGVRAAFTLRGVTDQAGPASTGAYARFNVATHVGDAAAAVGANRGLLRATLKLPTEPVWLRQVHGIRVLDVEAAHAGEARCVSPDVAPEADASVTRAPGRVLAIQVADCLPVLFASRSGSRVGAAHAGWRGLAGGVLEATLAALETPAADVVAWIGPGICQEHFEVGDEVREAFVRTSTPAANAFVRNARGRWQCDLVQLAVARLRAAGVASVYAESACTYADGARFYSYRRDGQCGRMAALIWLAPGAGSA